MHAYIICSLVHLFVSANIFLRSNSVCYLMRDFILVLCLVGKSASGKFGCPMCSASSPYTEDGELYTLEELLVLHRVKCLIFCSFLNRFFIV